MDRVLKDRRPITADVFLNNYCNNKCPYCTYRRWEMDAGANAMTYDEFKIYADRLIAFGVSGIILTGGGEPTLTPDFEKITGWLEAAHIDYGINTNFNVYRQFRPNYIKVSLDGWDEDSYEACRGVRAYHKTRENIIRYAEWKRENSPRTSLGIQKVISRSEDIMKFYNANCDLPVDYISLRPMESTAGAFYADPANRKDAEKSIEIIRNLMATDKRVTLNFKWDMLSESFETCHAHWAQIAVNERGQVMYCCHKPYQIVGHVTDPDIMDKYREAHTNMSMCDIPCRLTAPNILVRNIDNDCKDKGFI